MVLVVTVASTAAAACDEGTNTIGRPCWLTVVDETPSQIPQNNDSAQAGEHALASDRRDRIFYPGDTENLKVLGKKLLLNIVTGGGKTSNRVWGGSSRNWNASRGNALH